MLGQAVLFFLLLRGHQGYDCSESTQDVVSISGKPLWLQPSNIQTKNVSVEWKKRKQSLPGRNDMDLLFRYNWAKEKLLEPSNGSYDIYNFSTLNFALGIKSAKLQDSGHYHLEITRDNGEVCLKKFQILILDPVEKPHLSGKWKSWADGRCQLSLSCFVPKDDNVSYALYRGSKLILEQRRNLTYWEKQTDDGHLHTYTCTVSNKVSSANHTQNFTWGCHHVPEKFRFLPFVVTIVILVILFLGAATCFCVWDKKRKQSRSGPQEFLTIYECVKNPQVSQNQVGDSRASESPSATQKSERRHREADRCLFEEQMPKQNPPGDTETIYSMVQCKPSEPTSQEKCTLYSVIQPSRKSGSKKDKQNFSSDCTVYEKVGNQRLIACNPARLSRRELENFDIYS